MRSRRPATFAAALLLLLADRALAEDPPPAPAGFAWKRMESIKASFLVPDGWFFKEETKDGTRAFFITQEDIDKTGEFQTGLTINVQTLKKDPAPERAREFIAGMAITGQVQDAWQTEVGVLKGYGCRTRRVDEGQPPLIMHSLAIGNSRTNTLYLIFFESPEPTWDAAWKKGEVILEFFLLDDEI